MIKLYKKGVTIFIEADESFRIPSAYTAYSIKDEHIKIINLVDDSFIKIPEGNLCDEQGNTVAYPDNYLCEIIGSHN